MREQRKYEQLSSIKPSLRPGPVARMVGRCSVLVIGLSQRSDGGGGGNGRSSSSLLLFRFCKRDWLMKDDDRFAVDEHSGVSIKSYFYKRKRRLSKVLPFIFGVDGLCIALSVVLSKPER